MATPSKKPKELTLKEKVELINKSNGKSQRALAEQYGIGKSQVQRILKRKAELMTAYGENAPSERKRFRHSTTQHNEDIDTLCYRWFHRIRALNLPVSGPLLQEKARGFAEGLGISSDRFKASNGWLDRFKNRHNINAGVICGESGAVDETTVADWHTKLPEILSGYDPKDVYNMDESGLFFRALPDKTLKTRGEECKGGKKRKDRLTASFCVNMMGEFEKTLIIGKCARPRCFKRMEIASLPVKWEHNKKAWMNTDLFTRWVQSFDRRMTNQRRKVILLVDNAPSHPKELGLTSVKLVFLPANTTSRLQPLDQGIIKAVKANYRKRFLQTLLAKIDAGDDITNVAKCVSVLDAINWIDYAVKEVKPSTVKRCFERSGITEAALGVDPEDDLPLADLIEADPDDETSLLELVLRVQERLELSDGSVEDYLSCDAEVETCDGDVNGIELRVLGGFLEEQLDHPDKEDKEDEDEDEEDEEDKNETCIVNVHQALHQLEQLKSFIVEKDATHLLTAVYDLQKGLCDLGLKSSKQTAVTNFFPTL